MKLCMIMKNVVRRFKMKMEERKWNRKNTIKYISPPFWSIASCGFSKIIKEAQEK